MGPGVHGAVSEPSKASVGPKLYYVGFCVDLPGTPILSEVDLGAGRHFGCLVIASLGVFQGRLPPEIGQLSTLRPLEFNDCFSPQALPVQLGWISGLDDVRIHACISPQTLPEDFGKLHSLQV